MPDLFRRRRTLLIMLLVSRDRVDIDTISAEDLWSSTHALTAVDESIPSTPLDVSDAKSTERERVRAGPKIFRGDGVDVDSVSGIHR
jgi:hypothetical protein